MKYNVRYIAMVVAMLPGFMATAQTPDNNRFAVRATAEVGLGNSLYTDHVLPEMELKSSSSDYGVSFGSTIWKKNRSSIETNVGLAYGRISLTADLAKMAYHYSAPATADMDNVPYIRYYRIDALSQKIRVERLTLPIYLNYRFQVNKVMSLHALLGFKVGFNVSSKIADTKGEVFSYGIYPQYDDLMIDAPYMNEFGEATLTTGQTFKPRTNDVTLSFMGGLGAEIRIFGPLAVDISVRYEGGISDIFKSELSDVVSYNVDNVPVSYTVAEGQTVEAIPRYLSISKMSRLSLGASLIYRF